MRQPPLPARGAPDPLREPRGSPLDSGRLSSQPFPPKSASHSLLAPDTEPTIQTRGSERPPGRGLGPSPGHVEAGLTLADISTMGSFRPRRSPEEAREGHPGTVWVRFREIKTLCSTQAPHLARSERKFARLSLWQAVQVPVTSEHALGGSSNLFPAATSGGGAARPGEPQFKGGRPALRSRKDTGSPSVSCGDP